MALSDQQYQAYASAVLGINNGQYGVRNGVTGQVVGAYDIIPSTYNDLARRYPNANLGTSDTRTPEQEDRAMRLLAQEEAAALERNGLPVTTENLAVVHFFGVGGGPRVLQAAPGTPLSDVFGSSWNAIVAANPMIANWTVDSARNWGANLAGSAMAYAPTPPAPIPAAQAANQMGQGGQGKQGKTGPVGTGRGRETPVIDALSRFKQARAQNKDWRTALGFALGRTDLEGNPLPPTPTARPENPANTTPGMPTPQPNPNRFLGSTEKAKTNEVPALPGVAAGGGPASPTKTAPQSMGLGGFAPALPSGTVFALPQGGAQQPPTAPASALPPLAYRGSVNPAGPNPGWGGGFTPNTADAPRSGVANTLVNQLGGASGPRYDFGAMSPAELRNVIRNGDLTAEETQQALEVLDLRHQQAEIGTVMNPVVQEQTVATPQFDSPTPGMQGRYMSGNAANLAEQLGGGANNPQSDNYIAGPFTPVINPGPMSGDASQLIAQLGGSSGPMAKAAPSAARMADLLMAPNPNAANPAYQQALIRALGA